MVISRDDFVGEQGDGRGEPSAKGGRTARDSF